MGNAQVKFPHKGQSAPEPPGKARNGPGPRTHRTSTVGDNQSSTDLLLDAKRHRPQSSPPASRRSSRTEDLKLQPAYLPLALPGSSHSVPGLLNGFVPNPPTTMKGRTNARPKAPSAVSLGPEAVDLAEQKIREVLELLDKMPKLGSNPNVRNTIVELGAKVGLGNLSKSQSGRLLLNTRASPLPQFGSPRSRSPRSGADFLDRRRSFVSQKMSFDDSFAEDDRSLRQLVAASNPNASRNKKLKPILKGIGSIDPGKDLSEVAASAGVNYKALYCGTTRLLLDCHTLDAFKETLSTELSLLCQYTTYRLLMIEQDVAYDLITEERLSATGIIKHCHLSGKMVSLLKPHTHPEFEPDPTQDLAALDGPQIYLPIVVDGEGQGVLFLSRKTEPFDVTDQETLKSFVRVLGGCISNLRVHGLARVERRINNVMAKIANEVSQPDDSDNAKIISRILESSLKITDAVCCALFLVEPTNEFQVYSYDWDGNTNQTRLPHRTDHVTIPGFVVANNEILKLEDVQKCLYFHALTDRSICPNPETSIAFPVGYKGNVVAVLQLWNKMCEGEVQQFNAGDIEVISEVVDYAAAAICQGEALRRAKEDEARYRFLLKGATELTKKGLEEEGIIQAISEQGRLLIECDSCSIRLIESTNKQATRAYVGDYEDRDLAPERALEDDIIANGKLILVPNCNLDGRYKQSLETDFKAGSVMLMPIMTGEEVLAGVATFKSKFINKFLPANVESASFFLNFASLSLRNADFFRQSERDKQMRGGMLRIARELQSHTLDEHALASVVMTKVKELTNADRSSIFIVDENQWKLTAYLEDSRVISMPLNSGLAGHVAMQGIPLVLADAHQDARFNRSIDLQTGYRTKSVLCMPVKCEDNTVAVAQLLNKKDAYGNVIEFTQQDIDTIADFAVYAGVCLRTAGLHTYRTQVTQRNELLLSVANKLSGAKLEEEDHLVESVIEGCRSLVHADRCSLFMIDEERSLLEAHFNDGLTVHMPLATGIAGHVAISREVVLIPDAYEDPRFNRKVDEKTGYRTKSILCMPIECQGNVVAVAQLVNKLDKHGEVVVFTQDDVEMFLSFAGFAAAFLGNSKLYKYAQRQYQKANFMLSLANVLSSSSLDWESLPEKVLEHSKEVCHADRSALFVVDQENQMLEAHFEDGTVVTMALDTGIAGHVAKTRELTNIEDAYDHPSFNRSIDIQTGYRTRSILCMPVLFEDEVVAVAQLVNKIENDEVVPFSQNDVEWMEAFCISVGVSLRNAWLHRALHREQKQNETMVEVITSLSSVPLTNNDSSVIARVQNGARDLLQCEGCTIYTMDITTSKLVSSASESGRSICREFKMGQGIAGTVAMRGQIINVTNAYEDHRFDVESDRQHGYVSETILAVPIFHMDDILGVIEVVNRKRAGAFNKQDQELLTSFARLAGIHLGNHHLYEFAVRSNEEALAVLNMAKKNVKEGQDYTVKALGPVTSALPTKTLYSLMDGGNGYIKDKSLQQLLCTTSWDVHALAESDKVEDAVLILAHLFHDLGVISHFKISLKVLYGFLLRVHTCYRKVHYHNFYHAVDVTQTLYVFIKKLDHIMQFTPLEKLVLLCAGLLHDADHMGLNNSFHLKTDTPMGILSSASGTASVLEVHHCNIAIAILSHDDSDIFHNLRKDELAQAYGMLVAIILGTDMTKHKSHRDSLQAEMEKSEGPLGSPCDRELMLKLLVVSADISNVVKPFGIARKWALLITEEFFSQGDKEKAEGFKVAAMFDREASAELAQGQKQFIDFMAKPHFGLMAEWRSEFQPLLDELTVNYIKWSDILIKHTGNL